MPPGPRIAPQRATDRPQIASHVNTVGVRRTAWGQAGRGITVATNHFEVRVPQEIIHHYDVVISPADKALPAKLNLDIIKELQNSITDVFNPKAVYDGRKNMFSIRPLPLTKRDNKGQATESFDVNLPEDLNSAKISGKSPKVYQIRITKVAEINPEVLNGFLAGRQSHDNAVLTAITAMNVVIRMLPMSKYPFSVRSFFTDREKKDIGSGLILWRGYFQSVRPGGNKMWINIDISTGTMYKDMPLIPFCMEHMGYTAPDQLTKARGFTEKERLRLQRFVSGVRMATVHTQNALSVRTIKKVSLDGAATLTFQSREGKKETVKDYFERTYRKRLSYPNLPCVEVGAGALIPMELCKVVPGQLMRKQVPPEKTRDVLTFSTLKPQDRLASIRNGINVFEYETSEYMHAFNMQVKTQAPLQVPARVLMPPTLEYGGGGPPKSRSIRPENGAWNMKDKVFYRPSKVPVGWIFCVFERTTRFNEATGRNVIDSLRKAAASVGITGLEAEPMIAIAHDWKKPPGEFLQETGRKFSDAKKAYPGLIVAILGEGSTATYTAVKHFGDCLSGVPTQCMKANKCSRGSPQYYANICLKINVKLGGINCVPAASDVPVLTDPTNPTIVFGADVIHPAPGADGRPSFTALVGTLDSQNSKFAARVCVQESRVEMIQDMRTMAAEIMRVYQSYRTQVEKRNSPPTKIIFYRDGVSEGQFAQVLEQEVPRLKSACQDVGLTGPRMPKFTVIVVGKRHHVRFFPLKADREQSDQSGNCKAGTVVDRDVTHPNEFDFYLQSHAGLLGTSRPAHYNVLLDENNFSPDALQQLSFALCHVYARSTRSVSIPAPVYYADIVCARARNHFDPMGSIEVDTANSPNARAAPTIAAYKSAFKPAKAPLANNMYFS